MKEIFVPELPMPKWLVNWETRLVGTAMHAPEDQARLVVDAACENVRCGTGGPFAAACFETASGKLLALGINCVVPTGQSLAHAEMMAVARWQQKSGVRNLAGVTLAASCEPCVMCQGGVLWSGVDGLVYAAPSGFARDAGFDEGDKTEDWQESLERRGIAVCGPLLGEDARLPFTLYQASEGVVY